MRRGAGLHADQARSQRGKELQDLAALQLPADDNLAGFTDGMDLEHRLRDVQSDCANLLHGRLLSCGPQNTATWHIAMPAEEPSTASEAVIRFGPLGAESGHQCRPNLAEDRFEQLPLDGGRSGCAAF